MGFGKAQSPRGDALRPTSPEQCVEVTLWGRYSEEALEPIHQRRNVAVECETDQALDEALEERQILFGMVGREVGDAAQARMGLDQRYLAVS